MSRDYHDRFFIVVAVTSGLDYGTDGGVGFLYGDDVVDEEYE